MATSWDRQKRPAPYAARQAHKPVTQGRRGERESTFFGEGSFAFPLARPFEEEGTFEEEVMLANDVSQVLWSAARVVQFKASLAEKPGPCRWKGCQEQSPSTAFSVTRSMRLGTTVGGR